MYNSITLTNIQKYQYFYNNILNGFRAFITYCFSKRYDPRDSRVDLSEREPSTQKLGFSNMSFHKDNSLPDASIQSAGFPWCFPKAK